MINYQSGYKPLIDLTSMNYQKSLTKQFLDESNKLVDDNLWSQMDIKKLKKEYQIKIIELTNQIKFLKEQLQYKAEVQMRQLQNLKAILECQYTTKIRGIRNGLRDQYTTVINQNNAIKQKNKSLEDQIRILKLKYERAEKYSKQLQLSLSQNAQKIQKNKKQFEQFKAEFEVTTQKLKKDLNKQKQQQIRVLKANFKKQIDLNQLSIKKQIQKSHIFQSEILKLNTQIKLLIVQKEQLRIQKDKVISQQAARLQVLRQATIIQQMSHKKFIRQAKMTEIDNNLQQNFENSDRKNIQTMLLYKNDIQKQILLQKQMKKMSQTQIITKPQIKKICQKKNNKRNASTDISQSTCRRISIPDSPRFGLKMSQYSQYD